MKILVTDGHNRAALAITRSLGRSGHHIVVGENTSQSLAASSKYCSEKLLYPDPKKYSQKFIKSLSVAIIERDIDVIIPVSDITTLLISQEKSNLFSRCNIPFASFETITAAADKAYVTSIAKKIGIPVPNTTLITSYNEIESLKKDIVYPIVIKPSRSRIRTNTDWIYTTVSYANNFDELISSLKAKDPQEFPILLQERIEGPGVGIFMCFNQGELIGLFGHHRIREKPPSGGVSVLRESIPVDPVTRKYAEMLLKNLGWHGVAMVEFKIDNRNNTPKLMEINGRFWGSLQLAIDAGVDFPKLLLKTIEEKPITPILNYKLGVKTRWFWGDVDLLLMLLFKSSKSLNLAPKKYRKIKALIDFMKFWGKDLNYEILSMDDIKPWLYESAKWLNLR